MAPHKVVSREDWTEVRVALLAKEKEFNRLRDELSRERQALPWVKVEKDYRFEGESGSVSLDEMFDGKSQLIVFHAMFARGWDEACTSCSFWADNFDGIAVHLEHRDVAFAAISRAAYPKLQAYKARMGWDFRWYSSEHSDFNEDYHVSFSQEELDSGSVYYNYRHGPFGVEEAPGVSVFVKDETGSVFHSYSTYSRGLDMLNGAYHLLDLVPKGRDEEGLSFSMGWLRRHDQYEQ